MRALIGDEGDSFLSVVSGVKIGRQLSADPECEHDRLFLTHV